MASSADAPPPLPPSGPFRIGLIAFGAFTLLLGAGAVLMGVFLLLGSLVAIPGHPPTPLRLVLPALLLYLAVAGVNGVLGIGSILLQRWARSLLLLWSCFWLFCGTGGLLFICLFSGEMASSMAMAEGGRALPSGVLILLRLGMFLFLGLLYIVIPGVFIWFYSRPGARLACELKHPAPSWTDTRPLSVLGASLLHALTALCLPLMLLYTPAFPFFGFLLEGAPALGLVVFFCAFFAACAWGLFRLKPAFWWAAVLAMVVFFLSYSVTFWHGGLLELYRRMDLPEETLQMLSRSPWVKSPYAGLLSLPYLLFFLGLMVWIRRYFKA